MVKRYETRVLVEESVAGTRYFAQYKSYFLFIPTWGNFNPVCSPSKIIRATLNAYDYKEDKHMTMQEFAELQCEMYHKLVDKEEADKAKEKLHRKTTKKTYYKHP